MPRHSLPPQMKKFRSFDILLTQTTEDEIWNFFETSMREFEAKSKQYITILETFVDQNKQCNPYSSDMFTGYDIPSRISLMNCFGEQETFDMFEFDKKFGKLQKDLELCEDLFEEEYKCELIFDWNKNITNYQSNKQYLGIELKYIDDQNYEKTKAKVVEKRRKQKEEQDRKNKHSNHSFEESEYSYLAYDRVIYYLPDCEYCMNSKQKYDEKKDEIEKRLKEDKEREELYRKQEEELKAKEIELEEKRKEIFSNLKELCCEDCGFKTHSKYEFDLHNKTREHISKTKLKQWFCESCGTQARTEVEWTFHKNTKKHKIATGEIKDNNELHCEVCNYTCNLKHHFDQHCKSKKHIELTSK